MSRIALIAVLSFGAIACSGGGAGEQGNEHYFLLPWADEETWFYTGGPHCDGAEDGEGCPSERARYALDFAPRAPLTGFLCDPSENDDSWVTSAAAGVVRVADRSLVEIEHEDGSRTGYYHLQSSSIPVKPGDRVEAGARIGNPSCEHRRGGTVPGPHVHFYFCMPGQATEACLDDRESLITAGGKTLSGWRFEEGGGNYAGSAVRGDEERAAKNGACDENSADAGCVGLRNDLTND